MTPSRAPCLYPRAPRLFPQFGTSLPLPKELTCRPTATCPVTLTGIPPHIKTQCRDRQTCQEVSWSTSCTFWLHAETGCCRSDGRAPALLQDQPQPPQRRGLTPFFDFFIDGCPVGLHLLSFHSCQHLNINIPNINTDVFDLWSKDCVMLSVRSGYLFLVGTWLPYTFFSLSDMQEYDLSVNMICDFSCTYTFYVLSDWVNRA